MAELKLGEFFVGQSDDGLERLSLAEMVHLLIAGQTGAGKTQFMRQVLATVLTRTRHSHVCLIDMKGGIDYQHFLPSPNFELARSYEAAESVLASAQALFEKRRDYLLKKQKAQWKDLSMKELDQEKAFTDLPIGPVVIAVDELAELSKRATEKAAQSDLQEKIASLARLARFTGIHLILGTQRPDKSTLNMQSKDNLPSRVCFSVPSVAASNLVIGDMSASTLGNRPGRAVYRFRDSKIIQTPLLGNPFLTQMMEVHAEKMKQLQYRRRLSYMEEAGPGISRRETKRL